MSGKRRAATTKMDECEETIASFNTAEGILYHFASSVTIVNVELREGRKVMPLLLAYGA
jgi:hypothetical protein